MSLASKLDIKAARVDYHEFEGEPAVIIERYDRKIEKGTVIRLHQEDLCQALNCPPSSKIHRRRRPILHRRHRIPRIHQDNRKERTLQASCKCSSSTTASPQPTLTRKTTPSCLASTTRPARADVRCRVHRAIRRLEEVDGKATEARDAHRRSRPHTPCAAASIRSRSGNASLLPPRVARFGQDSAICAMRRPFGRFPLPNRAQRAREVLDIGWKQAGGRRCACPSTKGIPEKVRDGRRRAPALSFHNRPTTVERGNNGHDISDHQGRGSTKRAVCAIA